MQAGGNGVRAVAFARRGLASLALAWFLAGCMQPGGGVPDSGPPPSSNTPTEARVAPGAPTAAVPSVPLRIAVGDPRVIIAGPRGYCIDQPAARDGAAGSFVLLGSCAAIAGTGAAGQPVAPAVLTASVSAAGAQPVAPQMAALNAFFRSSAGLAALSRTGRAGSVTVTRAWGAEDAFYLAAQDRSPTGAQGLQAQFWRAVFDLRGHIVTLNVTGLRAQPLSDAAGRATLEAFVRQVRRENPKR